MQPPVACVEPSATTMLRVSHELSAYCSTFFVVCSLWGTPALQVACCVHHKAQTLLSKSMKRKDGSLACGLAPASIPTLIAYTIFVLSCLAMAVVGHPQCSALEQKTFTSYQAETLQGWVTAALAVVICSLHPFKKTTINTQQTILLQRQRNVRMFVSKYHVRVGVLILAAGVFLSTLMTVVPSRFCLVSEVRMLFIGATFTAGKSRV